MKTKRLSLFLSVIATSLMAISCGPTPNDYQEDIEEAVRYNIALINAYSEALNNYTDYLSNVDSYYGNAISGLYSLAKGESIYDKAIDKLADEFFEELDETVSSLTDDEGDALSIEEALEMLSNSNEYLYKTNAYAVLEHYRDTRVLLSKYQEVNTSSKKQKTWQFTEMKTGLVFYFHLTKETDGTYSPDLDCDDNSVAKYIEKLFAE